MADHLLKPWTGRNCLLNKSEPGAIKGLTSRVYERHTFSPAGNASKEHPLTTADWHYEKQGNETARNPMERLGQTMLTLPKHTNYGDFFLSSPRPTTGKIESSRVLSPQPQGNKTEEKRRIKVSSRYQKTMPVTLEQLRGNLTTRHQQVRPNSPEEVQNPPVYNFKAPKMTPQQLRRLASLRVKREEKFRGLQLGNDRFETSNQKFYYSGQRNSMMQTLEQPFERAFSGNANLIKTQARQISSRQHNNGTQWAGQIHELRTTFRRTRDNNVGKWKNAENAHDACFSRRY